MTQERRCTSRRDISSSDGHKPHHAVAPRAAVGRYRISLSLLIFLSRTSHQGRRYCSHHPNRLVQGKRACRTCQLKSILHTHRSYTLVVGRFRINQLTKPNTWAGEGGQWQAAKKNYTGTLYSSGSTLHSVTFLVLTNSRKCWGRSLNVQSRLGQDATTG